MANTVEKRAEGREQRAEAAGETRERRAWARVSTLDHIAMANGRLHPGRTAQIIDVSPGGALIETDWRLLPGTRVELQLGDPVTLHRVKSRILRCHVTMVDRERIRYRGALVFEEQLPMGSSCTTAGDFPATTSSSGTG